MSGSGPPLNDRDPIISPEEIDELVEAGWTMTDIARDRGTTPQNIWYLRTMPKRVVREDRYRTPREIAKDLFPWKNVGKPFNTSALDVLLRAHAEYMESDGEGMSLNKLKRLHSFYLKLRQNDWVVEFHPDIPPSDYNKHGGYAYRPRIPVDGDLIIRRNELAQLTPEAEVIWRFPRRLPLDRE